jgi:predicted dehydrogenase
VFELEGGARAVYEGSWHPRAQFTDWNCRWLLECEGGYLVVDGDRVLIGEGRDPHDVTAPAPVEVPLAALALQDQAAVAADFMRAVRAGEAAPTAAADNLRSLEMVFAAVESAQSERPVALAGYESSISG